MVKVKQVPGLEGRAQRKAVRKEIGPLKDCVVSAKTRARYDKAVKKFFQYLEDEHLAIPVTVSSFDDQLSDYIDYLWQEGEGKALASDTVAALQDKKTFP